MKLKICMLLSRFYPVSGGTELQAQRLSEAISAEGHSVFVLTSRLKGLNYREKIGNIEVYRSFARGRGMLSSLNFLFSSAFFLFRNRRMYDIIHVHLASSHAFAAIAAKIFLGKKIVLKFGGARATGDIGTSSSRPWGGLKLFLIKKSFDAFIAPGREVFEEMAAAGFPKEKIRLIPNGADTETFSPLPPAGRMKLRSELGLPSGGFQFAYTGRIEPGKGLDALLPVWDGLPENARLVIVGAGSLEAALKKKFGGRKNIIFAGYRSNACEYLRASDAFVFPSFGEGMSNSLLEAMSCGLVVIAGDIPANRELIADGKNGIITDIRNAGALKALLADVAVNYGKYSGLGAEARRTVEQKYSIKSVCGRNIEMYASLMGIS